MFPFWLIEEGPWKTPIDPEKAASFGFLAERGAFFFAGNGIKAAIRVQAFRLAKRWMAAESGPR